MGLDTVTLDGKPFTLHVEDGNKFKKGDLLIDFDKELILKEGLKIFTSMIITNSHAYKEVIIESHKEITSALDQELFTVVK
nr:PTS glucose transporter subunit IIA [Halalkalibacter alkalisediminis]